MSEMIGPLVREARELRETVSRDGELRRKESRRLMALVVVLLLMIGGLLTIAVQNRRLNGQNAELIRKVSANNQQIADCTTAGGKCYQEGQERTGEAILRLVDSNIAVHRCVERNPGASTAEIKVCVMKELDAPQK